ncbi:MAG: hypothetical protein JXB38_11105 [Anaerolineales bacterium]|nr:hypothetical protein [Anaerolineales bacterium]
MTSGINITVLPIHRESGFDRSTLPGLQVASAPRRAARGRKNDRLILFISFEGDVPVTPDRQKELLLRLAKGYYEISGTVTSALTGVAENLNQFLLQRNLRGTEHGQHVLAALTMLVVRDTHLYLAHSGPVHTFLATPNGTEHFYDTREAGRGLGLSRNAPVKFFQAELTPGMILVATPKLPVDWNEATFQGLFGQNLSLLRRRLLSGAGTDLQAVAIQVLPGEAGVKMLRGPEAIEPAEAETSASPPAVPPAREPASTPRQQPAPPPTSRPVPTPVASAQARQPEAYSQDSYSPPQHAFDQPAIATDADVRAEAEPRRRERQRPQIELGPALLEVLRSVNRASQSIMIGLRDFFGRMLPDEPVFTLPTSTKLMIAVAVPLVVVTLAMVMYTQIGQESQYEQYYAEAQLAADQALGATEFFERQNKWETVLFYLNKAEEYRQTEETEGLRNQALQVLDQMNGVTRLDFQPALNGGLSNATMIGRLVFTQGDLYMLDETTGSVLRARLAGDGYELDPEFVCGPQQYGAYIVGPLVDMTALPDDNEEGAAIAAMDANGNMLMCFAEEAPLAITLVPPSSNWGDPTSMVVENGNLYVLDPLTNAVWIFDGGEAGFREPPYFFFGDEVPSLQGALDIALSGERLYVLHDDGHVTTCEYTFVVTDTGARNTTTCVDPATFEDDRSGREYGPFILDASFSQITRTPSPEPSIFLLDPIAKSAYHFGLRLKLIAQYRPGVTLPDNPVTAFAISPKFAPFRTLFIAVDNEVYLADLP